METFLSDLHYAFRTLRNTPGFTAAAVMTLALGIGGTTAIFTIVDRIVLRPLPYDEPDRLVYIDSSVPSAGENVAWGVSAAGYFYLREHNRTFEELGVFGTPGTDHELTVIGQKGATRLTGVWAGASLLRVLRARPVIGRLFHEEDEQPGLPSVALISHRFWLREYGADPGVIGTMLDLEGGWRVEVVGVLEPGFHLPDEQLDIWVPLGLDPAPPPDFHGFRVIGRLARGVNVEDAAQEMARLTAQFPEALPEAYSATFLRESGFTTRVTPLHTYVLGGLDGILWILLGSVALVLLIACSNVANLVLVRAETRRRDQAIRVALGTTRLQLARKALTENLLLTVAAGGIGVWLADGGLRLLLAIAPSNLPRLDQVSIGVRSAAVALAIAASVGVAFGCLPLLRSLSDVAVLRGEGVGITLSKRRQRVRGTMVVAQMSLALVLLATAGLMLRSFDRLRKVQPGFEPRNVLAVDVFLPKMHERYGHPERLQQFYRDLIDRVASVPQAQEVGAGDLPLKDEPTCFATYVEGRPLAPGQQPPCIDLYTIAPGFFKALRIPIEGREPEWAPLEDPEEWAGREVVVTRALAKRLWPDEDPIGRGIRQGDEGPPYARVVGVTGDIRGSGLDRPPSQAIFGQILWDRGLSLAVRTEQPEEIAAAVRSTILELEPLAALGQVQTMESVIAGSPSMARVSFTAVLLGIGAMMGLLLSAIGLFGVLAYWVGQRRAEIGIRMALGAKRREVATLIVGESLKLTVAGAAVGLFGTLAMARLLGSQLFEVSPTDPLTLGAVAVVLFLVALAATYIPAHRAAQVDPMIAVRAE